VEFELYGTESKATHELVNGGAHSNIVVCHYRTWLVYRPNKYNKYNNNKQIPTTRDSREESAVEIRFHVKRAIHRQIYTTPIVSGAFDFGVSSRQNRHRHTGVFVY